MGGTQTDEQVDVIGYSADSFGHTLERFHDTAEVGVETGTPFGGDQGCMILRAKDDVAVEAQMRGGHDCFRCPCRGRFFVNA